MGTRLGDLTGPGELDDENWPEDPLTGEPNDPRDPNSPVNLRREANERHRRHFLHRSALGDCLPDGNFSIRERFKLPPDIVQSTKTIEVKIPAASTVPYLLPGVGTRPVRIDEIAIRVLEGNPDALLVSFETTERPGYVNRVVLPADWFDARLKSAERYRRLARVVLKHDTHLTVDCINQSDTAGRLLIVSNLTFPL